MITLVGIREDGRRSVLLVVILLFMIIVLIMMIVMIMIITINHIQPYSHRDFHEDNYS